MKALFTRIRREDGFTMTVALGVLTVVALLTAAALLTVQGDAKLTRSDLDGKRAYAAAQAAAQAYLYSLNSNPHQLVANVRQQRVRLAQHS